MSRKVVITGLGTVNALATVVPDSDATQQAPFQVGGAIEWSGTLQRDPTGSLTGTGVANQPYVSAWNIEANVGIYTSPGATPAYVNMELSLLGVGGSAITAPTPVPEEVTTRIRARGFFSDPQRSVDLFAVQLDPCSGVETEVLMLVAIPNKTGGVPWGRFRDVDQAGLFPITRQWRARYHPIFSDPPPPLVAANGLTTMQFTLPVGEYVFPENTVYGDPALLLVPNNFQDFPFLAQGEGPWRGDPLAVVGPLTPFPLTDSIPGLTPPAPAPFACPATSAPSAVISPPSQTVSKNSSVTLSAAASHSNPLGDPLTFAWTQLSGPAVTLADPAAATTTFQAPNVSVNTGLTFEVLVTDTINGQQAKATTLITVTPGVVRPDTVVITSALYRRRELPAVFRAAHRCLARRRPIGMRVVNEEFGIRSAQQLRLPRAAYRVPTHVRSLHLRRKPRAPSGENPEPAAPRCFLAAFEQPLHAHADAEERHTTADSVLDRTAHA